MAQDTTNTRLRPMPGALRLDAAGVGTMPLPVVAIPSRKALWTLGAIVLLGHLVLLQTLPEAIAPPDRFETRSFTTRTIVVAPPAPKPVEAARAEAAPVTVAKPQPPRKVARPKPAPVESSDTTAMQATAPTEPVPVDPPMVEAPAVSDPTAQAPTVPASAPDVTQQAALPQTPASGAVVGPTEAPSAPPATASALTLAIPGSTRLKYNMTGEQNKMPYTALGEVLWLQDGQSYDIRMDASTLFFSRTRTSSGKINERGLSPSRFSEKIGRRAELATHFERDKGMVSFSSNRPSAPLGDDMQDQVSVLMQVASMIAGDPARYAPGTKMTFPVAGPRDAESWTFSVEPEELLYLPAGQVKTVKIIRNPRREFDQKVEAWLAADLGYLPVRLKITNPNADFFDMQLRSAGKP